MENTLQITGEWFTNNIFPEKLMKADWYNSKARSVSFYIIVANVCLKKEFALYECHFFF